MTSGILFVENYIPGGSDRVARMLMEGLPLSRLTVMVNRGNDTRILLAGTLPAHVTVERYGLVTIPEFIAFAKRCPSAPLRLLFHAMERALRYPFLIVSIAYFLYRIARTGATVFVANNGGYPAGNYCRSATIAAAMVNGVKVFHVIHGMAVPARGRLVPFEWLADRMIDRCSRIITVCRAAAIQLKKVRWIKQDAEVIYNGLANRPMCPVRRVSNGFRILNVGYFDRNKNQAMLIRAIAELVRRGGGDITAHFVGVDAERVFLETCRKLAADLGVADRVCFEEFNDNVDQHYIDADLFVLCSNSEGFSIAILEAMRAGKPVVATDVGGVREQVLDGISGFLVAPNDHLALADRIGLLVRDRDALSRFGAAGRTAFEERFTMDGMISAYSRILGLNGKVEPLRRSGSKLD